MELKERKHRIEDAVRNAKAAVEEGIVAGGGVALLQSAPALEELKLTGDEATGANIVRVALEAPLKQIAFNSGLEPGVVAEKVRNLPAGHGLNAQSGDYEDLLKAGVADPVKVTRSALQNAASIAALFLTTEAVVADKPEKARRCCGRPDRRHGRHGLLSPNARKGPAPKRSRAFSCLSPLRVARSRPCSRVSSLPPELLSDAEPRGRARSAARSRLQRVGPCRRRSACSRRAGRAAIRV